MSFLECGFFKGKKILITGHTGFKGSWLGQVLIRWGARVCGYALEPKTDPNLFETLGLEESIDHRVGDIRDFQLLNNAVGSFAPDIVFHLAAQPLVRDSYDDPHYTYEVNVLGTVNILEAIRLNGVRAGIIVTTDKVYKNLGQAAPFREEDPLGGYDPYSNSKACADLIVNSYIQSFFNPGDFGIKHNTLVASVRAGNVIGGGDWARDRLVPDLVRALLVEQKEVIIRNPKAIRPWQYVLEPLFGYMMLAKSLFEGDVSKSGAWNFGPMGDEVKDVEAVVRLFTESLGKGSYVVREGGSKHEDQVLRLDSHRARRELKWYPRLSVKEAVKNTASWYKSFYTKSTNMYQYTSEQIESYLKRWER